MLPQRFEASEVDTSFLDELDRSGSRSEHWILVFRPGWSLLSPLSEARLRAIVTGGGMMRVANLEEHGLFSIESSTCSTSNDHMATDLEYSLPFPLTSYAVPPPGAGHSPQRAITILTQSSLFQDAAQTCRIIVTKTLTFVAMPPAG